MSTPISTSTGDRHLNVPADDIYWFAGSPAGFWHYVGGLIYNNGTDLTTAQTGRGDHYGDLVDVMRGWVSTYPAPVSSPYIETEDGLLGDAGKRKITPPELDWAVWSSLVHGARMVQYFGTTSNYGTGSTFGFPKTVAAGQTISVYDQAKATNARVKSVAPILNSPFALGYVTVDKPGYVFPNATLSLANGIDLMAKYSGGQFYVFATVRGAPSQTNISATFTTKDGYTGPVTVVGEGRTVEATGGVFSDTFASAATAHIYRVG
jgi:hypothetical protein